MTFRYALRRVALSLSTRSEQGIFPFRLSEAIRHAWISRLLCLPRHASTTRWKTRQANDAFAREAKVRGLMSRAAFKLIQINDKHHIFKRGNTVVDLGYAPGSWSQVAANRCAPGGRIIGVDVIPAQPPRGVTTIQGNFLSPEIQAEVRAFVLDPQRGRPTHRSIFSGERKASQGFEHSIVMDEKSTGYIDMERRADLTLESAEGQASHPSSNDDANNAISSVNIDSATETDTASQSELEARAGQVVDVVLSDMSAPWSQLSGFGNKSVSDPYHRMQNTSGNAFRDHAGSMDLCNAALNFAYDTLRSGGHFVCKYYQGPEETIFEKRLRKLFEKVHREKPDASRKESKEAYFVALRRRSSIAKESLFSEI